MQHRGQILEVRLDDDGQTRALITCPSQAIPAPGQYLQAIAADGLDVLPTSLFRAGTQNSLDNSEEAAFLASPIPAHWGPGTQLHLRGPLGHGFAIPNSARHIALANAGESAARLLPLLSVHEGATIALFTDSPLPHLSSEIEVSPLAALPDALNWADFLALDAPLSEIPRLNLNPERPLPCPAQVLIQAPMPCGGLAECGVCSVPVKRGWKLACMDGPVFDWKAISF